MITLEQLQDFRDMLNENDEESLCRDITLEYDGNHNFTLKYNDACVDDCIDLFGRDKLEPCYAIRDNWSKYESL